jgi:beta-aspartyl-peptidase (threonine type)
MHTSFQSKLPLIAIHGGAGDLRPEDLSESTAAAYHASLDSVLKHSYAMLEAGRPAMEVVVEAVRLLEDDPLFNAGKGSVFTSEATHEMDAAVMCGASGHAGAIAGVRNLKNPVLTALEVLNEKDFVLLGASGAEAYAKEHGHIFESNEYFYTEARFAQLKKAKEAGTIALDHHKYGTVGAVAVGLDGHCAAATSTGGLTNKRYGRIGDSPIIGAGTYAEDATCALSCTGYGEPFLLRNAAYQVSARMKFGGVSLEDAMRATVEDDLIKFDGDGGIIAVDPKGHIVLCFNSAMMYRGWAGGSLPGGTAIG